MAHCLTRKSKLRIIFELSFDDHRIYVARIDQRGACTSKLFTVTRSEKRFDG